MAGDHGFDCQIKGCPAELPSNSRNNGVSSLIHTSLEQPHGFFGQPLSQSCKHWPWLTYWQHYKTLEFGLLYCQTIARSNFRHQKPGKATKFKPSGTCEAADRITFCGKALPLEASAAISWNHSR